VTLKDCDEKTGCTITVNMTNIAGNLRSVVRERQGTRRKNTEVSRLGQQLWKRKGKEGKDHLLSQGSFRESVGPSKKMR